MFGGALGGKMFGGGGGGGRLRRSNSFSVTGVVIGFGSGVGIEPGTEEEGTKFTGLGESGLAGEDGAAGAGTR
jgi:hypothetical protein